MSSRKHNCSRFNKTYKKFLSKKKIGGCGCQQGQQAQDSPTSLPGTLFSGGRRRRSSRRRRRTMKGGDALGPASLTNFDPGFKYTYPLNSHVDDPIAPVNVMSVRMQPNMIGGRRKRRRSRKVRGGSSDPFIKAYESNTLSSPPLTSLAGAANAANIVTGQDNPIMRYSDNIITGRPFI